MDSKEAARMPRLEETVKEVASDLEEVLGNNIRVVPLVGIKHSFIVRSDET
jgi:hypothetical protein